MVRIAVVMIEIKIESVRIEILEIAVIGKKKACIGAIIEKTLIGAIVRGTIIGKAIVRRVLIGETLIGKT